MSSRIKETSENISAKLLETSHIGHSEEDNDFELSLFSQATEMMWKFIPPVILVLGTFGNVMTIVMMRRMSEGQSSHTMSLYFTALAVSDLVLLYAGLLRKCAINFYLYCLSGARFRGEVKKIFCGEQSSQKQSTTTIPMTINTRNDF
ncbi:uncharacterized protein LOC112570391 [Pomacea canaliculata]|uniref:uncharacterized protein LOC112570391 n=1 Tax=Pomacea canaliculata TaxID=400727 RepID=UPI000D727BE4|nr:uncharacterized protein LOC112570391 [Pomacea canaliculata]